MEGLWFLTVAGECVSTPGCASRKAAACLAWLHCSLGTRSCRCVLPQDRVAQPQNPPLRPTSHRLSSQGDAGAATTEGHCEPSTPSDPTLL